jgi:2-dehydro-3-deoxyphosphogluconate aldolase/(4S)-4-hydroxy-2-oxoglutarate aldolase
MKKKNLIIARLEQQGLLPLFYDDLLEESVSIIQALYDGGIRIIEYTNRGKNALSNFKKLIKFRDEKWPDLLLAAGTIKTAKDAKAFCKAKADIIISPGLVKAVAERANESEILWIPGCMTPTEIILAEELGATLVKIFPGNILGPGYISAIREIFPNLKFMPTGGVETTREGLEAWFNSGVSLVGAGSKLINKELLAKKDFVTITNNTRSLLELIHEINHRG